MTDMRSIVNFDKEGFLNAAKSRRMQDWNSLIKDYPDTCLFLYDYELNAGRVVRGRVVGFTDDMNKYKRMYDTFFYHEIDCFCVYTGTDISKCRDSRGDLLCVVYINDTGLTTWEKMQKLYPESYIVVSNYLIEKGNPSCGVVFAVAGNSDNANEILFSLEDSGIDSTKFCVTSKADFLPIQ